MDWSNECDKDLLEANAEFLRFCEEVQKRGYKSTYGTNGYSENLGSLGFYINAFTPYYSLWKDGLFPYHHDGKDSTYGFIYALNAVKRYSNDYPFFYDPEYHTDVVIMSYNTSEQVTTNSNHLKMLNDALAWYKQHNITISVVGNPSTFHTYENIVSETGGVFADINGNFSKDLEPLMKNMISSENDGCLVHLSNGTIVKLDANPHLGDWTIDSDGDGIADLNELMEPTIKKVYNRLTKQWEYQEVWSFLSNPIKQDTDGDGLYDIEDLRPTQYDCLIVKETEEAITFNSGRVWKKFNYSAYDYMDNLANEYPQNPIAKNELVSIINLVTQNDKIYFSNEEMAMLAFLNNEGAKLYLDKKSVAIRETIFEILAGRKTKYYQRIGSGEIIEVSSYDSGGFFQGKVLSEADINLSMREYCVADFYDYVPAIIAVGGTVIATYFVATALPFIVTNIKMIQHMWQTYGFQYTYQMYRMVGYNGIISIVQVDMMDGDSSLDDIAMEITTIFQYEINNGTKKLDTPQKDMVNNLANHIAKGALKNRKSDILVLGKYFGETNPNSYQNVAKNMNGCYYSMPQDMWLELNKKYKGNFMWLVNQRAIEQQLETSKKIIFSVDPRLYQGTATYDEFLMLQNNFGLPMDLLNGYYSMILR